MVKFKMNKIRCPHCQNKEIVRQGYIQSQARGKVHSAAKAKLLL